MNPIVSIVVSPREGFSTVLGVLEELLASTESSVPIVVVEGGSQPWVIDGLRSHEDSGRIHWLHLDYMPTPNEARNIGASATNSRYVVFVDNDIAFETGWLEELIDVAEHQQADVVGPTICIGPPRASIIHHAGGILQGSTIDDDWSLHEQHRLKDQPFDQDAVRQLPKEIDVVEFHCMMVRRSALEAIGPLDERLTSREEKDFALRCVERGLTVRYACRSVVTYMARARPRRNDPTYLLFRWSHTNALSSLETFEETWGVVLNRHKVLDLWIGGHRRRLMQIAHPWLGWIYPKRFGRLLANFLAAREPRNPRPASWKPRIPSHPDRTAKQIIEDRQNGHAQAREPKP